MQWRDYLISEIQGTLRDIYRFYQTDSKAYYDSEHQKLVRRIDSMFNTYLRENVVKGNINLWCNYIKKFLIPPGKLFFVIVNQIIKIYIFLKLYFYN